MSRVPATSVSVTVENLSKIFSIQNSDYTVFERLSLKIAPGEIVALCGKSGVGKSTLLRLIAGLQKPTSGKILIDDKEVDKPISHLGFVAQEYSQSLLPWLRVESNVALPLMGKGIEIGRGEREARVLKILGEVCLKDFARSYPWQLSGGMQQRVAIARALVVQPQLLILDEPFGSLDTFIRMELTDLVLKYVEKNKVTTIFATHDLDDAIYIADRVLTLAGKPSQISVPGVAVDLLRPRDQVQTRSATKFAALKQELYNSFA